MPKFRKRVVEFEAVQLRWTQWDQVCELLGEALITENPGGAWEVPANEASDTCGEEGPNYIALNIRTTYGHVVTAKHGDWLIPEKAPGRFIAVEPRLFAATYEPAP
ncbi:hypothetical protein [Streptomyces sp. 1222.5]|uniref:hypothetical protein n=1 Tax=Streptomyces sp. 1222.5 TaxID=1881026 RepID=UPI003EBC9ECD